MIKHLKLKITAWETSVGNHNVLRTIINLVLFPFDTGLNRKGEIRLQRELCGFFSRRLMFPIWRNHKI